MGFLALGILSSSGVALTLRFAASRRLTGFLLFGSNYLVALVLGLLLSEGEGTRLLPMPVVLLAAGTGVLYVLGFVLLSTAVERLGTAVATSVARVSVATPLLVSILIFGERGTAPEFLAMAGSVLILPLASRQWPPWNSSRRVRASGLLLAVSLFLVIGVTDSVLKVRAELFPESDPGSFFAVLFGSAALLSLILAFVQKELWRVRSGDAPVAVRLALGVPLGAANFGSAYFLALALERLPGAVAYSVNALGVIVLAALLAALLFRERPARHNYLFFAASAVVLILMRSSLG